MTLCHYLLCLKKKPLPDAIFMNHDNMYARQQKEMFILFFYLWYLIDYVIPRCDRFHHEAYLRISFGDKTYAREAEEAFLKSREPCAFLTHFKESI